MCPIFVVIADVLGHEQLQMPLIANNHVIRQVAAATRDPALGDAILPRAADGRANWLVPQDFCGRDDISAQL